MVVVETNLEDCLVLKPKANQDERGYFYESYNQKVFNNILKDNVNFVQDNQTYSTKGVLRGLHFQKGDFAQAKLVRVTQGNVLDIVVDLRKKSSSFGQSFSCELSDQNQKQLFVPKGFAHGFVVLSETAIFQYKCDNYYNKESEGGIIYNDSDLNIDWILPANKLIISQKDLELDNFKNQSFAF
jgi:dTDP-4-dehydrorhamnose 3,5-epimerase